METSKNAVKQQTTGQEPPTQEGILTGPPYSSTKEKNMVIYRLSEQKSFFGYLGKKNRKELHKRTAR